MWMVCGKGFGVFECCLKLLEMFLNCGYVWYFGVVVGVILVRLVLCERVVLWWFLKFMLVVLK